MLESDSEFCENVATTAVHDYHHGGLVGSALAMGATGYTMTATGIAQAQPHAVAPAMLEASVAGYNFGEKFLSEPMIQVETAACESALAVGNAAEGAFQTIQNWIDPTPAPIAPAWSPDLVANPPTPSLPDAFAHHFSAPSGPAPATTHTSVAAQASTSANGHGAHDHGAAHGSVGSSSLL